MQERNKEFPISSVGFFLRIFCYKLLCFSYTFVELLYPWTPKLSLSRFGYGNYLLVYVCTIMLFYRKKKCSQNKIFILNFISNLFVLCSLLQVLRMTYEFIIFYLILKDFTHCIFYHFIYLFFYFIHSTIIIFWFHCWSSE